MAQPKIAVLGLGKMGAAAVRRLVALNYEVAVWNRTEAKGQALAAESALVSVKSSAREALACVADGGLALAVLSDTQSVEDVLGGCARLDCGADFAFANITSGSPADGHKVRDVVAECLGAATYVDGAYCGPPASVESGTGQLFLASDAGEGPVTRNKAALDALGDVVFCGRVGSSRALDYAVVDLAFVNYVAFAANAAMLEREGVDTALFAREAAKRLSGTPRAIELAAARMAAGRDDASYADKPVATLGTWRNFWASRLPYFVENNFPTVLVDFAVSILDAAGARDAVRSKADMTRLQEVLKFKDPSS